MPQNIMIRGEEEMSKLTQLQPLLNVFRRNLENTWIEVCQNLRRWFSSRILYYFLPIIRVIKNSLVHFLHNQKLRKFTIQVHVEWFHLQ